MHPFFFTVIGAIFILSLVIIQLFVYGRAKKHLNIFLEIAIFGSVWYAFIYLMTNSGYIRSYPWLFNKGLPLYYAIAPCFYIYIRGSLNKAYSRFRKIDLLHFLILIPAIIAILPYNMLNLEGQQQIVDRIAVDIRFAFSNNRYIVNPWHWFTFPLSAIVYTVLQFRLAWKARKDNTNRKIITWIYLFSALCLLIFTGMLLVNILILRNLNNVWFILHQSNLILILCGFLLLLSLSFFVNPEFIFGFRKDEKVESIVSENEPAYNKIQSVQKIKPKIIGGQLVQQVDSFINEKQVFRQNGLTLSELASLLDIPNHKLSDLFNNHYQLNFNTYINNLRIVYVKQRLDSGDWKHLTLEAIALDAGFASRNTFFVAFKKVMGKTPSAYLSNLKQGQ